MRGEARSGEGAPSPQGERVGRRGKSMAQRKSSALDMYLRLHCEADWREKQIKVGGYLTRLVGLVVAKFAGGNQVLGQTAQRLSLASAFFSTSRRLLWLGRVVQNVQWMRHALRETDTVTRFISLAGIGFGSMCNILDDLITLDRVGILAAGTINVGKLLTATSRLWMSLTLCTFALNRIRLARLCREQAALKEQTQARRPGKSNDALKQGIDSNSFQLRISRLSEFKLVADLCMNVAYSFNVKMGDSWFASCGLLSGVLAMRKIWLCSRQTESLEIEQATSSPKKKFRVSRGGGHQHGEDRQSEEESLACLPAITPRSRLPAHEQLKRVTSSSFHNQAAQVSPEKEEDDIHEYIIDSEDGGPFSEEGDDTAYSFTPTKTAAELRRIMSSARIGSILELEQIARQDREDSLQGPNFC